MSRENPIIDLDLFTENSEIETDETSKKYQAEREKSLIDDKKPMKIDPNLKPRDLHTLITAEIDKNGLAGHHIDSMNHFYEKGLQQIITKIFKVEDLIQNERNKTDEDNEIKTISFKVTFTDSRIEKPMTSKYRSGKSELLVPNMARLRNLTYSGNLYVSAKIEAIATTEKGKTIVREDEIKDYLISSVPIMVGSKYCNTYGLTKAALKEIQEDPNDKGGYFIAKGVEWAVTGLENIKLNEFHAYKNIHKNEIARGNFISKLGDNFENSYQLIIKYINTGGITIEITTGKFNKIEFPFYIIFRLFGITSDRQIADIIVNGIDLVDSSTRDILNIVLGAFNAPDKEFAQYKNMMDLEELRLKVAAKVDKPPSDDYLKDEDARKYRSQTFMAVLDKYILPHIGHEKEKRIRKLWYLGHLINKLLRVVNGSLVGSDRDNCKNKRVHSAGVSLAKTFKANFNFAVVQELKKKYKEAFKNAPFSKVNLREEFHSAIKPPDLEKGMYSSITSGNKSIKIGKKEMQNRVASQQIGRQNDLYVTSIIRTVNTANTSAAAKQTERAVDMRSAHVSYMGYYCPVQSADTGEKVGVVKQLGSSCSISGVGDSYVLKEQLLRDPDVIPLEEITNPGDITKRKLSKVLVNGDWIGYTQDSSALLFKYRIKRRFGEINSCTSLVWNPSLPEINFWIDLGRYLRPLVIVYNNMEEYIKAFAEKNTKIQFRQWTKLTKKHIIDLQNGTINMDDLRKQRIIEYIAPEEQENTYQAMSYEYFVENANNVLTQFTHINIPISCLGMMALSCPLANHSNCTRTTYHTNQRKQTCGWFALNWPFRIDKNTFLQYYCESPLVKTYADSITNPSGQTPVVSLQIYSGYNQEDSSIVCKQSVDNGFFQGCSFYYEQEEAGRGESFADPNFSITTDIKHGANYENLENGFVKVGTIVYKNDVLIHKRAKIPNPTDQYKYADRSVIYKKNEPAIVERVINPTNSNYTVAKVQLRSIRHFGPGDKASSRTGNKTICSQALDRADMPYSIDGIVPDVIVNPHSIPSRMAINQLIECFLGLLATAKGTYFDATVFTDINVKEIAEELKQMGYKYLGARQLFSGITGSSIDTLIFIGPTSYQRLQKFVKNEAHAIEKGPVMPLTHQPLAGKANNGSGRSGEMEVWTIASHGAVGALQDKLNTHSDGTMIPICRNCGNQAVYNERENIQRCNECKENADIVMVRSTWTSNLFVNKLKAMGVDVKRNIEPYEFNA